MSTNTNNSDYGDMLREEREADQMGTFPRSGAGNRRRPSSRPATPRNPRPLPTDETSVFGDIAPDVVDPTALSPEEVTRGLKNVAELKRQLAERREDSTVVDTPTDDNEA